MQLIKLFRKIFKNKLKILFFINVNLILKNKKDILRILKFVNNVNENFIFFIF